MRVFVRIFEFSLVVFKRNTAEVASISQLRLLEVATLIVYVVPNLLKSL